ncbi:PREDICTED: huntingtin-interacting protein 1-like, partial [Mesitornis unicolor]|uniref:huntingtin-interacting protein 1-like n=1 Tax=Mesitornis unicolor TaxID=54374 RepID=UPI000529295D
SELVQNHADLLRKNAEVTKQVTVARQAQGDVEREKKELEDSFQRVSEQAQRKSQEQAEVLDTLKRELAASRQELQVLQGTLESSTQAGAEQSTRIAGLEQERDSLSRAAERHGEEVATLRAKLQQLQDTLRCKQESRMELKMLQTQLRDKLPPWESGERALQQRLAEEQFALLQGTARAAQQMVQDALGRLEDPAHIGCTGSAGEFSSRAGQAAVAGAEACVPSPAAAMGSLLPCLALFAHLVSDTLLQGSATSHVAPMEPADRLLEMCKQCGSEAVSFLSALQDPGTVKGANCSLVMTFLSQISTIGEELRPKGLDIKQEELGDLVDKEMAATAAAIETAAARIEEMLSKARAGDTGVKLEVNERILGSCTGLMQAIHVLVLASKDLQREIVESGRGAASPKEFYAKNSRWTEGLISASKAVGWGATVMVDAADLVVQGKGTFEELMVCSREIAASTAQLVAASKVKADKDSANLCKLQQASRGVNQATAGVVASTKAGKSQVEEKDSMDFSSMTLTQIKRQEMDSQVRVLELENQLQKERQKLGELRKKHYELAGVAEGWEEEGAD